MDRGGFFQRGADLEERLKSRVGTHREPWMHPEV